jgi:hypothetical protein
VPDYIEYGSLATVPGPLRCEGVTQWCFPLEADRDCLEALCRRVFTEPTGSALDIRPLGSHVILTLGRVDRIVSEQERFETMGYSPEGQSAIWIPVARVRADGETLVAEQMLMFTPYMWVDNPISLASGRDMYGFSKTFGWVDLPSQGDEEAAFGLDVFGMDYGRDEPPTRRPLVRVSRGEHVHELADVSWSALLDVGRHLRHLVEGELDGAAHFGLHFAESLIDDVRRGGIRQLFMHQLRSIGDGSQAALQQVTEASYTVTKMRGVPLEHEYTIELAPLDSHPLGAELGLAGRMTTRYAYRTESAFTLQAGRVLWDSRDDPPGQVAI